jgi:hypothetical protein
MKKLLLFAMLLVACSVRAQERVQESSWNYPADNFRELTILNHLGNVDIRQGGDQFEIRTEIRVAARTMDKVDEVMQYLRITASDRQGVLALSTISDKDFTVKKIFFGVTIEVDYHVKIPKGKKLSVANRNGNVLVSNFAGDLNIEVISGNFKARKIEGDFTAKLTNGTFEVEEVNDIVGDFTSAAVKIPRAHRVKLTGDASDIQITEATETIAKLTGGIFRLASTGTAELHASGAKCEIMNLSGALRADTRYGELFVNSILPTFAAVDITSNGTKITLALPPDGGFNVNFRHDNMKIVMPPNYVLETKPTTNRRVVIETGFIGDKQYRGQLSLNITGGRLLIL